MEPRGFAEGDGRTGRRDRDPVGVDAGHHVPAKRGRCRRARAQLNDYLGELAAAQPNRFGFFATIPMPHLGESVDEAARSLDELGADGVVLLANSAGTYLGQPGQDECAAR